MCVFELCFALILLLSPCVYFAGTLRHFSITVKCLSKYIMSTSFRH